MQKCTSSYATSYKLHATSCKLQAASYKLQATSCKLQAASYKLQATSHKLQATCYIEWLSAGDQASFDRFHSLWEGLGLRARFAPLVDHAETLRLYSAFFVVRSACAASNMHVDYSRRVGTRALALHGGD